MFDDKNSLHSNRGDQLGKGVMLNAYPDSIGQQLGDLVGMLKMPQFKNVFSQFYILPTFFNSDLDRGFSIIDYDLNHDLVSEADIKALSHMNIQLKFDIVLNHLSVASPQFQDLLDHGSKSKYKDFFIDWNEFWEGHGKTHDDGVIIPREEFLDRLFMRKFGLPILKVYFPDGTVRPYWNTFYQDCRYNHLRPVDLEGIIGISAQQALIICEKVNLAIDGNRDLSIGGLGVHKELENQIMQVLDRNRSYLGQMDLNARSALVWDFYQETIKKISSYGGRVLRLDAFAYLHKEVGQSNFFNRPGTWEYLDRIRRMAKSSNMEVLPEIHAEYGSHLHAEVAGRGYLIYDFFLPGLMLHALEKGTNRALIKWIKEIVDNGYKTVNMLGCHDGIPVLDLKGKELNGVNNPGLLLDKEIEELMDILMERGGRVKNLYDSSGKKISYYQINATFFSALGESEEKLLMARAIQMFMPGIPQVWYLDIFAGKNNYRAADSTGSGGHKEINRSNISLHEVKKGLDKAVVLQQLSIMRLRNTSKAFMGSLKINETSDGKLDLLWAYQNASAQLRADLRTLVFTIDFKEGEEVERMIFH
ncbi:MAG: glycosidase [Arenibacter sp.]|nr:glycosidase [Arenibacter sp.]